MISFRFAHTTAGEESYSAAYEPRRAKEALAVDVRAFGLSSGLAAIASSIGRWNRYRRTVAELRRLDDRTLRDIGLQRDEIGDVARGLSRRGGA